MFDTQFENSLDNLINSAICKRITPGVALAIGNKEGILFEKCYGKIDAGITEESVNSDTMYDLAGLTSVIGTTLAIMRLVEEGKCSIYDTLGHYYGIENDKMNITIKELLTHTAGFREYYKLYKNCSNYYDGINSILKMSLVYKPNTKVAYSELGLIILGNIIEKITDKKLDEAIKELVFDRLEMGHTGYNIDQSTNVAPTERKQYSNEYLQGVSFDCNCRFFGGMSGHTGLFSNLNDMKKVGTMLVNEGMYNEKKFITQNTFNFMTKNLTENLNLARGLGWALSDPYENNISSGELITPGAFGHSGFTGTSIWIDKEKGIFVVILSNRTHPEREDRGFLRLRRLIHNYIFANV